MADAPEPAATDGVPSIVTSPSSNKPTPSNAGINIPQPNRHRQPVPPSPLSRIQSEPSSSSSSRSGSSHMTTSPSNYTKNIPESSPCFIHSHLDRHGSLQDWLKNKPSSGHHPGISHSQSHVGSTQNHGSHHGAHGAGTHSHNGPTPTRATPHPHHLSAPRTHRPQFNHYSQSPHSRNQGTPSPVGSPSDTKSTSPMLGATAGQGKDNSNVGYDSDRSSPVGGSAILDGDLIDDDEDGGSLTKQLAETAQGVREMSKELGT